MIRRREFMTNVFDEFTWRGSVYDCTEGVPDVLGQEKITAYIGFDPTADSLHVGSLAVIMVLARLQRFGHTPIALAGGGTGMIGDPSGKTQERQLLTIEQIEANLEVIKSQLAHFLDFEAKSNPAIIDNNANWLRPLLMMDFLRDTGKHFTVNYMIAKDSVKSRLNREDGISYTEFSYMLLQAYDFLKLFDRYGCVMQSGGSDQWGNITAGVELIRRVHGKKAYGLVCPLITTADGTKFGKTEVGTVWLDPKRTSPYRFYQYWLNQDDRDVINYLKYFTWLTQPEIEELEQKVSDCPEEREAQRTLACEITRAVHGETALAKAEQAAQVLFGGELAGLSVEDIQEIFEDSPSSQIPKKEFEAEGMSMINLLEITGLASSRGDARRLISGGGIYVNNIRVNETAKAISLEESLEGQFLVLRKGKKNYHLVQVVE
jgi:tyrosyl-tRNA synthetase